jgi:hypothetical protein
VRLGFIRAAKPIGDHEFHKLKPAAQRTRLQKIINSEEA